MKLTSLLSLVLFTWAVSPSYAQAPATVADTVLTMTLTDPLYRGPSISRWLRADGTFQDIYAVRAMTRDVASSAALASGRYEYAPSGATAQLSFHYDTPGGDIPAAVQLTFANPTSGNFQGSYDAGYVAARFTLRPAFKDAGPINLSCRMRVTKGQPAIARFVIATAASRIVLLRAAGPSLAKFGITDGLPDPYLALDGDERKRVVGYNSLGFLGDAGDFAQLFRVAGAFPLDPGAGDSAEVTTLAAGAHTVVVGSASGQNEGTVLVEAYFLP